LTAPTADVLQAEELVDLFYSFGDGVEPKPPPEIDDRLHESVIPVVPLVARDEGTIDFDDVNRERAQIGDAGISGSEVI
jgi:hypothetical protein